MKIYMEIDNPTCYSFQNWLKEETWSGARDRILNMSQEELDQLCEYLNEIIDDEEGWSETQVNDFIWFEWDDIYEEMKRENNE